MNANPTWLDGFFTPSTNGRAPVTIGDVNRTEIIDVYSLFRIVYAGTLSMTRTILYPGPSDGTDATAYTRFIYNGTNHSLTISTGSGNTITIATLRGALIGIGVDGVSRLTADSVST